MYGLLEFSILLISFDSSTFSHTFAIVQWIERHHSQHILGKPVEISCPLSYYCDIHNSILPLERIVSLLLNFNYVFDSEGVLVTVPLL